MTTTSSSELDSLQNILRENQGSYMSCSTTSASTPEAIILAYDNDKSIEKIVVFFFFGLVICFRYVHVCFDGHCQNVRLKHG